MASQANTANIADTDKSLIVAAHGTLFLADAETPLPTDMSQFKVNSPTVDSKWYNIGHTSKNNPFEFTLDGGDVSTKDTFMVNAARVTHASKTLKATGSSVQADSATFNLIYGTVNRAGVTGITDGNLDAQAGNYALFFLLADENSSQAGLYLPNASFGSNSMPKVGSDFLEFGFSATAQASKSLKRADGSTLVYSWVAPEGFVKAASGAGSTPSGH